MLQVETSSMFAKLFVFVLILSLPSSNCSAIGIRDGDERGREDDSCMMRYNTTGDAFTERDKANVLCALPAKDEARMGNNLASTSYPSRPMYEIDSLIGDGYLWLKLGTTAYEEYDRIWGLVITSSMDTLNPMPNAGRIIQIDSTLLFSASEPLNYHTRFRIAVPVRSIPGKLVDIFYDEKSHIEVQITYIFKEAIAMMPPITYQLVPFYNSYDQMVRGVYDNLLSAAVGDAEITQPYIELNQVFSFVIPFTNEMWFTLTAMTVFNALVIWLVESTASHESGGLPLRQVGAIFWFPLATLFYGGHRESPKNNLTYFVLAPWFLLILLVTSTYTTTFTSTITSSGTESSCGSDIEHLKQTNAIVGCDMEGSITSQYLVKVLGFRRMNIKHIAPQSSIDDYAEALSTGNIKAAFFWTPDARFFLAKYCKGFGGPNCNLRGYSVIFPRDSPSIREISEAMMGLRQSGEFMQMHDDMLSFSDCSISRSGGDIKQRIGPRPFSGLFILSGSASAIAMLITVIRVMRRRWERLVQGMLIDRGLWVWLTTLFSPNQRGNRLQLPRM